MGFQCLVSHDSHWVTLGQSQSLSLTTSVYYCENKTESGESIMSAALTSLDEARDRSLYIIKT